ncbi:tetratricopeptide repeat protein [Actinokineospora enzanensis]|uniref:tetratricopeptide repeat protein n=1 Tax=Actinokineospora enzanensis TaxID=155975 RepID=UPI000366AAC0|nr:tetratricopeptide repeat protein [Actinokineospora enzanensis]
MEDGSEFTVENAVPGQVSGRLVQAGSIGAVHFHGDEAIPGLPAQLPPAPAVFAGRETELADLDAARAAGAGLVVLTGIGGVGKSALAAQWANAVAGEFTEGHLFADLTDTAGDPVTPADAQEWFLLSLGVKADRIPVEPARRAALYRSTTATRRLLVLLDNAVSAAQVRALLPTGAGSLVVVTSRSRLSGLVLDGARWLTVDPLASAGSLRLLRSVVGADRVASEPDAAAELVGLCGGLPLALAVVGARLATRARRTLSREVRELRDERMRLRGLRLDAETSVSVVLDHARAYLDGDAELAYRACAWHPGREFGAGAIAAGLEWPMDRVIEPLDELVEANMVTESPDDRFVLHDLIRLHARESRPDDPAERLMVEWYLDRAVAADTQIHPLRPHLGPRYAAPRESFDDRTDAMAWMTAERHNLRAALTVAAAREWDDLVWQLCEAQWGYFLHTRRYGDWIDMQLTGITSTQRLGDVRAEGKLHAQVAYAYAKSGSYPQASDHGTAALRLARECGDLKAEATALSQLGHVARSTGDLAGAVAYYEQTRDLHEWIGRPRSVAMCRRRLGDLYARLGRAAEAVIELTAAAAELERLGDTPQYAKTVLVLSATHLDAGRSAEALRVLRATLRSIRELDSPYYEAEVLTGLGDAADHAGDRATAVDSWTRAAELYDEAQDPKAEEVRARFSATSDR